MHFLSSSFLLLFLSLVGSSFAHIYLSSLHFDGKNLNEGECVRLTGSNSPISSVTSADMTCGFKPKADQPASTKCPVAAGSKMGMQWYHSGPQNPTDIVDASHRGPCIVYMAKNNEDGNPKWFKIYENGYDTATKKFCVDTLITNLGLLEFTIPVDIEPGNYLVRGELIALHEAQKVGGAQPYVGCGEVTVTGKGKAKPATVVFPGAYKPEEPGIVFDIYNTITSYPVPGPALYKAGQATGGDIKSGGSGGSNGKSSGGMSAGGTAALVIFFLGLALVIAGGAFYYHKNGEVFGKTLPIQIHSVLYSGSSSSAPAGRAAGNYVAYVDQEKQ